MPIQHKVVEPALVSPAWVEARLGISRRKRLELEEQGVLGAIRLTLKSHRRYERSEVEALAVNGTAETAEDTSALAGDGVPEIPGIRDGRL